MDYATDKDEIAAGSAAAGDALDGALTLPSPVETSNRRRKKQAGSESDTDFQADTDDESEQNAGPEPEDLDADNELGFPSGCSTTTIFKHTSSKQNSVDASQRTTKTSKHSSVMVTSRMQNITADKMKASSERAILPTANVTPVPKRSTNSTSGVKPFKRAQLPVRNPMGPVYPPNSTICHACREPHPVGACQLKAAGVEHCGLCGLAHYGQGRTCPHIRSETQVHEMLLALKSSNEPRELVDLAAKYLRGVKGTLVRQKKRDREKAATANGAPVPQPPITSQPSKTGQYVVYLPTAPMNGIGIPAVTGQQGLPQREIPKWYDYGSVIRAQQQRQGSSQIQAQGQMSDKDVAYALQDYLQK